MAVTPDADQLRADIATQRFDLEALRRDHAVEMLPVLADMGLYTYIGGRPPDAAALTARYERQTAGPDAGDEVWLNWIVRRRSDHVAIGYVQATLIPSISGWTAQLAWLIGTDHQGNGAATEAAHAVIARLREQGIADVRAHIADGNRASAAVARRLGLIPSDTFDEDGERLHIAPHRT